MAGECNGNYVSGSSSWTNESRSGRRDETKFIYDLSYVVLKDVSNLLDVSDRWKLLGGKMGFTMTELLNIEQKNAHTSCTMQMNWSMQNHTVAELFVLLSELRMHHPMSLLKDFVSPRYHHLHVNYDQPFMPSTAGATRGPVESADDSCCASAQTGFLPKPPLPSSSVAAAAQQQQQQQPSQKEFADTFGGSPLSSAGWSHQHKWPGGLRDEFDLSSKCKTTLHINPAKQDVADKCCHLQHETFTEQPTVTMKPQPPAPSSMTSPNIKNEEDGKRCSTLTATVKLTSSKPELPRPPLPTIEPALIRPVEEKSSSVVGVDAIVGRIPYEEIIQATKNFTSLELGRGGFGVVYEGLWKRLKVAIKKIENKTPGEPSLDDAKLVQSYVELKTLNHCRYDNVLSLYGYAEGYPEGSAKTGLASTVPPILCLVYQFMVNGSLEDRLLRRGGTEPLSWTTRLVIARGSARGLQYLHSCEPRIIHGDIKSANILLDVNFEPKLGDFGLARYGPAAECTRTSVDVTAVHGTKPYLPEEFLRSRQLSTKVDTYSFGVVLLELATGLRAFVEDRAKNLRDYVDGYDAAKYDELRDRSPGDIDDCGAFLVFIHEGIRCTKSKKKNRPEMADIFEDLDVKLHAVEARSAHDDVSVIDDYINSSLPPSYSSVSAAYNLEESSVHQHTLPVPRDSGDAEDDGTSNDLSKLPRLTMLGTKLPST